MCIIILGSFTVIRIDFLSACLFLPRQNKCMNLGWPSKGQMLKSTMFSVTFFEEPDQTTNRAHQRNRFDFTLTGVLIKEGWSIITPRLYSILPRFIQLWSKTQRRYLTVLRLWEDSWKQKSLKLKIGLWTVWMFQSISLKMIIWTKHSIFYLRGFECVPMKNLNFERRWLCN